MVTATATMNHGNEAYSRHGKAFLLLTKFQMFNIPGYSSAELNGSHLGIGYELASLTENNHLSCTHHITGFDLCIL